MIYDSQLACGFRKNRKSGNARGRSALVKCVDKFRTQSGIDIVLFGNIPIEIKLTSSSAKRPQLKRYCRFGANAGTHVALYMYWKMPSKNHNRKFAKSCWKCWGNSCKTTKKSRFGSIYGAIGIVGNKGKNIYVPNVSLCRR